MGLTITVERQADRGRGSAEAVDGESVAFYRAAVEDDEYPQLAIGMSYMVWTQTWTIELRGVSILTSASYVEQNGLPQALIGSNLRDLPFVRWESASRAKLAGQLNAGTPSVHSAMAEFFQRTGRGPTIEEVQEVIGGTLLRLLHPGIEDDQTPAGKRRYRSLHKMAMTAAEYIWFLEEGRIDPAVAIAEKYGVPAATTRSWIFRARQGGFLPSAPMSRPTGEALDESAVRRYTELLRQIEQNLPDDSDGQENTVLEMMVASRREAIQAAVEPSFTIDQQGAKKITPTDQALRLTWLTTSGILPDDVAERLAVVVEAEMEALIPKPPLRKSDVEALHVHEDLSVSGLLAPMREPKMHDQSASEHHGSRS